MELIINSTRFTNFVSFNLTLAYNSIASAFTIRLYFDINNAEHRRLLRPGASPICKIEHGGEVLITGYIISYKFDEQADKQVAQISGYSLPGVLEDCQFPPSFYPLQDDGLDLRNILIKYLRPFGLGLQIDGWVATDANTIIASSTAKPTQSVRAYLGELCSQQNIVLSHTDGGDVLLTRALVENQQPAAVFTDGMPGVSMSLSFDGQRMHSEITVMQEADLDGGNVCEKSVSNPYVPIFKSAVLEQNSGDDNTTELAAIMARSKELAGIKLTIQINKWDPNSVYGNIIIRPNLTIGVRNPNLYINTTTKFFIESVDYTGDAKQMTATLHCVVPEVYSGTEPQNIFAS
jgi:prophage tail gpP-like protein